MGNGLKGSTVQDILSGLIVAAIVTIVELYPLNINEDGDLTVGEAVEVAALLFLPLEPTLIGVAIGEVVYSSLQRRPVVKTCFNAGQTILSCAVAYFVFRAVGGLPGHLTVHAFVLPLTFVVVNTLLVAWIISLSEHQSIWQTWTDLNRDTLAYTTILGISGLAFGGLLISYRWLGSVLVVVLVICLWAVLSQASFSVRNIKLQFLQTVRVLTTALEYRDPYTCGHSTRVADWCRKIAIEMGLNRDQVHMIELGGLMHDVGKVGIPDLVLNKPGELSREEFEQIKVHPVIGERILQEMEGMQFVALMARQHHFYYNGDPRGYPDQQLLGGNTYVGSRILSVADAWDAMITDRPYRKAFSVREAIRQLLTNRGTQFDPEVVDAFVRVLVREGFLPAHLGSLLVSDDEEEVHSAVRTR